MKVVDLLFLEDGQCYHDPETDYAVIRRNGQPLAAFRDMSPMDPPVYASAKIGTDLHTYVDFIETVEGIMNNEEGADDRMRKILDSFVSL